MNAMPDHAADLPDHLRVAHVLLYISPDGRRYLGPLGTPDPDPDRALPPAWTEIAYVAPDDEPTAP